MGRLIWWAKQLTPRTYWTTYGEVQRIEDDGSRTHFGAEHFVIWKMWLGHCYDVIDFGVPDGTIGTAPNARAACYPLPSN